MGGRGLHTSRHIQWVGSILALSLLLLVQCCEASIIEVDPAEHPRFLQQLQGGSVERDDSLSRGRRILTVIYLSILACCFACPLLYYCVLCYQEHVRSRDEGDYTVDVKLPPLSDEDPSVQDRLQACRVVLTEEHFRRDDDEEGDEENPESPYGDENVRIEFSAQGTTHQASGLCTICLTPYEVGSSVVWSTNPQCEHVFHAGCMEAWMETGQDECPCCRQAYLQ